MDKAVAELEELIRGGEFDSGTPDPIGLITKSKKENTCPRKQLNIIGRLRSTAEKPLVNMTKPPSSTRRVITRRPLITLIQRVATSNSLALTPTRLQRLMSRSTAKRAEMSTH
jgi:hypothetical protein